MTTFLYRQERKTKPGGTNRQWNNLFFQNNFLLIFIVKFFFKKSFQKFGLIQWNDHILAMKRKKNKNRWNKSAMKYVKYVIKNVMDIPYWLVCRLKKNQMEGPFIWYPITHYTTPTPSCDIRYRTLFPYQPDPMPRFFRHTLRSRI